MANFIHYTGTNGFLTAAVNLVASTELSSLSNGNTVQVSTTFSQANFNSAQRAALMLTVVTAGWNVSAGGNLTGWFQLSDDGGSNFEANISNTALPRAPDFIIPLPTVSPIAVGRYFSAGPYVLLPYGSFKVYIQNNTGAATSGNSHTLKAYPVADTYA